MNNFISLRLETGNLYGHHRVYKPLRDYIFKQLNKYDSLIASRNYKKARTLETKLKKLYDKITYYRSNIFGKKVKNIKQLDKTIKDYHSEQLKKREEQFKKLQKELREKRQLRKERAETRLNILVMLKMRMNRTYDRKFDLLIQKPIKKIDADNDSFNEYIRDPELRKVHELITGDNFKNGKVIRKVFDELMNNQKFNNMVLKVLYIYKVGVMVQKNIGGKVVNVREYNTYIRYSEGKQYDRNEKDFNIPTIGGEGSDIIILAIGYQIAVNYTPLAVKNNTIHDLLAFNPTNNRKFHELTTATTGNSRICIYESFLDAINKITLRYMRQNKKNHDEIMNKLKLEGEEIENAVKSGQLIKALQLLTKKYNQGVSLFFYDNDDQPLYIFGDKVEELKERIHGEKILIYSEKDKHVGVSNINNIKDITKKEKEIKQFCLRPKTIKKMKKINNILGLDIETYNNKINKAIPFCITAYGLLKGNIEEKIFYGKNCLIEFISYIESIRVIMNCRKARQKIKIDKIMIFGFNNASFDNLLIFKSLYDKIPYAKIQFANNKIKYIKFDNIKIYDISNIYSLGSLRKTCEAFGLKEQKSFFPYAFPKEHNLDYIGRIPEIHNWNNIYEFDEGFKLLEGKQFNLREYTTKYCLQDSKLVYELAKIHLVMAQGEILGKKYNVINCPTSANMSLKIFQQVFLKDDLYESKKDIQDKERKAYKGGRTEVFKKQFKEMDRFLYYIDINSSYPYAMTKLMPFKYIKTTSLINYNIKLEEIIDHHLYLAKSEYIGNKDYIIPNLLIRNDKNEIETFKNTDFSYHWGIELKEAINNEFNIYVNEINEYEGKAIFKEYAEYFYDERLKNKKSNPCLASFYKMLLNSLYGKFGQKKYTKTVLLNENEYKRFFTNDDKCLLDWEVIDDSILCSYKSKDEDEDKTIGSLIRFASYITSYARSHLSEVMRDIGHEHIYYCDTDSIFTDKLPDNKYLDDKILGKWKAEESKINEAHFIGKKLYYYETDKKRCNKAKGINANDLLKEDYIDLQNNESKTVASTKIMFFRSYQGVIIKPQERRVKAIYNKRTFIGNNSISK